MPFTVLSLFFLITNLPTTPSLYIQTSLKFSVLWGCTQHLGRVAPVTEIPIIQTFQGAATSATFHEGTLSSLLSFICSSFHPLITLFSELCLVSFTLYYPFNGIWKEGKFIYCLLTTKENLDFSNENSDIDKLPFQKCVQIHTPTSTPFLFLQCVFFINRILTDG